MRGQPALRFASLAAACGARPAPAALAAMLAIGTPAVSASSPPDQAAPPPACCCNPAPPAPAAGASAAVFRPSKGMKYALLGGAIGAAAGLALGADAHAAGLTNLRGRPWLDSSAFALGVGGLVLPKALEDKAAQAGPSRWSDCRCDAAGGRHGACADSLNGFDRGVRKALVARDRGRRQLWSDLSDAALAASLTQALALIVAAESDTGQRGRSLLVFAEAGTVALGLNGITKHVFHRPRPYTHFGEPPDPGALAKENSRLSFFSGHATASFAAAVTAGRLADPAATGTGVGSGAAA